jgi:hypothetical protein
MSKKGQHQAIPLDVGRFGSPEEALAEAARLTTSVYTKGPFSVNGPR